MTYEPLSLRSPCCSFQFLSSTLPHRNLFSRPAFESTALRSIHSTQAQGGGPKRRRNLTLPSRALPVRVDTGVEESAIEGLCCAASFLRLYLRRSAKRNSVSKVS
jgi:hypothetical protein